MARKTTTADPIAQAWNRIEAMPGAAKSLAPPLEDFEPLASAFEYVFEFSLPDDVEASYKRHDGERAKACICPPLRLVSADEALTFAAALAGQGTPNAHVKALTQRAAKYDASMQKQGLRSSSEPAARWTLAVGKPGHRIAVDCNAEWVIEERPDGSVAKLADDYASWLAQLAGRAAPTPVAKPKAHKPIDKIHRAFVAAYGAPVTYREGDAKTVGRLTKLYPWLGNLVARDGFAVYGDQIWTCDPDEYTELAALWTARGTWLERFEWSASGKTQKGLAASVFARSAFGHALLLTATEGAWLADPEDGVVRSIGIIARGGKGIVESAFSSLCDRSGRSFSTAKERRDAVQRHGAVAPTEAYFWDNKKGHHAACSKRDLVEGTRRALGGKR